MKYAKVKKQTKHTHTQKHLLLETVIYADAVKLGGKSSLTWQDDRLPKVCTLNELLVSRCDFYLRALLGL